MSDHADEKKHEEGSVWAQVDVDLDGAHPEDGAEHDHHGDEHAHDGESKHGHHDDSDEVTDAVEVNFRPKKSKLPIYIAAGALALAGVGIAGFILIKVMGGSSKPVDSAMMEMDRPLDVGNSNMPGGMIPRQSGGAIADTSGQAVPVGNVASVAVPVAVASAPFVAAIPAPASSQPPIAVMPDAQKKPVESAAAKAVPLVLEKSVPETSIPEKGKVPVDKDVKRLVLKPDTQVLKQDANTEKSANHKEETKVSKVDEQERHPHKRAHMAKEPKQDASVRVAKAKRMKTEKAESVIAEPAKAKANSTSVEEVVEARQVVTYKLLAISPNAGEFPLAFLKTSSDKTVVVREGESLPDGSKVKKIDYMNSKVTTSNGVIR